MRFPGKGVKLRRIHTVGSESWVHPRRENQAASVWERVTVSEVRGKPRST